MVFMILLLVVLKVKSHGSQGQILLIAVPSVLKDLLICYVWFASLLFSKSNLIVPRVKSCLWLCHQLSEMNPMELENLKQEYVWYSCLGFSNSNLKVLKIKSCL